MRKLYYPISLCAFLLLLASCSSPTGTVEIAVTGIPAGGEAAIAVTGPNGYDETVTESGELRLPAGTYTVSPATIEVDNAGHAGVEVFEAEEQQVTVVAGETVEATVSYAYTGFAIADPEGDTNPEFPAFDLTGISTRVTTDALEVTLTFVPGQTELDQMSAYIGLDTDQDPMSGAASPAEEFCIGEQFIGMEYELEVEPEVPGSPRAALIPYNNGVESYELADPVITDNRLVITVPREYISDEDLRINGDAVLGSDGPSDCVPYGDVVGMPPV